MAKIKNNLCSFIFTIGAVITGILSFVSLAFKVFAKQTTTIATKLMPALAGEKTVDVSFKDWLESLKTNADIDGMGILKTARVFMIITLVLVAIAAVLAVVNFFVKNKYLNIALIAVGGLAVISVIIMLITLLVGSNKVSDDAANLTTLGMHASGITDAEVTIKNMPGVIPICLSIFGILTGAATVVIGSLGLKKSK